MELSAGREINSKVSMFVKKADFVVLIMAIKIYHFGTIKWCLALTSLKNNCLVEWRSCLIFWNEYV